MSAVYVLYRYLRYDMLYPCLFECFMGKQHYVNNIFGLLLKVLSFYNLSIKYHPVFLPLLFQTIKLIFKHFHKCTYICYGELGCRFPGWSCKAFIAF